MKMSFRWYGNDDPVTLTNISQIPGMRSVVSAVYSVPVGEVWPMEAILEIKDSCEKHGLIFDIVESVPVHEDIKLGKPSRECYIENYCQNIRNLAKAGVKVICYNFMPVFDWLRSSLNFENEDGSTSLIYREEDVLAMDPSKGDLSLPGWDSSYTKESLGKLLDEYKGIDEEALWRNVEYFLKKIIPVCEECDVKMAIHMDDPPWDIFGLPRLLVDEPSIDRFLKMVDDEYNCLTLCSGSLNANPNNNVADIVRKHCDRIAFAHIRNVKHFENGDFSEASHRDCDGDTRILDILKAYHDCGYKGYVRPDHGRHLWGEKAGTVRPGYGLYDRALGIMYMLGVWDMLDKINNKGE